jgi:hypothetical protein
MQGSNKISSKWITRTFNRNKWFRKSYLANMIYNYAVEQKIIESDKQFVIANCSEFANNSELLTLIYLDTKREHLQEQILKIWD